MTPMNEYKINVLFVARNEDREIAISKSRMRMKKTATIEEIVVETRSAMAAIPNTKTYVEIKAKRVYGE
jgi:hypothetical protein